MSYPIVAFISIITFCIGMLGGIILTFNAIIEIVTGLVDFLIERRNYTIPDEDDFTEE